MICTFDPCTDNLAPQPVSPAPYQQSISPQPPPPPSLSISMEPPSQNAFNAKDALRRLFVALA